MVITIERVREAYQKTGATPIRDGVFEHRLYNTLFYCPICAVERAECTAEQLKKGGYIGPAAALLGVSEEYIWGFIAGVDSDIFCDTTSRLHLNKDKRCGFDNGVAIRKELFGG